MFAGIPKDDAPPPFRWALLALFVVLFIIALAGA